MKLTKKQQTAFDIFKSNNPTKKGLYDFCIEHKISKKGYWDLANSIELYNKEEINGKPQFLSGSREFAKFKKDFDFNLVGADTLYFGLLAYFLTDSDDFNGLQIIEKEAYVSDDFLQKMEEMRAKNSKAFDLYAVLQAFKNSKTTLGINDNPAFSKFGIKNLGSKQAQLDVNFDLKKEVRAKLEASFGKDFIYKINNDFVKEFDNIN